MKSVQKIMVAFGMAASVTGFGLLADAVKTGMNDLASDYAARDACAGVAEKTAECRAADENIWGNTRQGMFGVVAMGAGALMLGTALKKDAPVPSRFRLNPR